jgi:flagellar motor switch protein FliM
MAPTSSKLLSQEEIDALVNSAQEDTSGFSSAGIYKSNPNAEIYDLASEDSGMVAHLSALEMMSDRFSRMLRVSLSGMLQYQPKVKVKEMRVESFGDFRKSISPPLSLNIIKLEGLRGTGLIIISTDIIFNSLDRFFGGGGRSRTTIEGMREFTPTETRVIQMIVDRVMDDLEKSWLPVYPLKFEHQASEINPQFAQIVEDPDLIIASEFEIEMLNEITGTIQVVYPFSSMKPIRHLLKSQIQADYADDRDRDWKRSMRDSLKQVNLEIKSDLAYPKISLYDLMNLKVGDIIPIKMPDTILLQLETVPTFEGVYGTANGNAAVRILGLKQEKDAP